MKPKRKTITIAVGPRIHTGTHLVESQYSRESTINVLRNMAHALAQEYKNVKFKELA